MKDYIKTFDAANPEDQYKLIQKWMKEEPLPFFAQLRKERPILVTKECTLVTLFSDVTDILNMPKIFTVDLYKSKMGVTDTDEGYLMAHDDDALHYREKSLMKGILNREDLPHIRKLVSKSCSDILNKQSDKKIEVVNQYCRQVPAIVVQDYFGLDGVEAQELLDWSYWNQYDAFHNQPFDLNSDELNQHILDNHARVTKELGKYILILLARKSIDIKLMELKNKYLGIFYYFRLAYEMVKNGKPSIVKDDVVTRILKTSFDDEIEFGLARKGVNIGGLLIGSIETTSQAVTQIFEFFIEKPELLTNLRKAAEQQDTYLFDAMIWEALRFVPISPYVFRQASITTTVAEGTDRKTEIKVGTNVLLATQSAMFDNYAHEKPDEFNPDRNWYHHFNFGFGSHECLGKYVGMVMIPEMVRHIIKQPNLKAEGSINYEKGPFPEEYNLSW